MTDRKTGKLLKKRTNLALRKETLRTLNPDLLRGPQGGAPNTPGSVLFASEYFARTCAKTDDCKTPGGGGGGGDLWKKIAASISALSISTGISQSVTAKTVDGKCHEITQGSDFCSHFCK